MQLGGVPSSPPDELGGLCGECRKIPAVGPCAACEQMICGDCGVLTRDPNGPAVICMSCARLVADVNTRRPSRQPPGMRAIAIIALLAFLALALSLL